MHRWIVTVLYEATTCTYRIATPRPADGDVRLRARNGTECERWRGSADRVTSVVRIRIRRTPRQADAKLRIELQRNTRRADRRPDTLWTDTNDERTGTLWTRRPTNGASRSASLYSLRPWDPHAMPRDECLCCSIPISWMGLSSGLPHKDLCTRDTQHRHRHRHRTRRI